DSPQAVSLQMLKQAIAVLYPKHMVIYPLDEQQSASVTPIAQPYPDISTSVDARQSTTAMAASSDGEWLVIGDDAGMVSSYQWHSESQQLILSSSKPLHQGRVNALCFEPVSQYFFSAGTDKQLYRTHVQGELHAIDRAKASGHSQMITALCVSDTRLFTAADDASIKSWAFDKGQPSTCKENLNKTTLLTYSRYAEKPALLAVGTD
ncbi:WD40 repeat domain-containing protein, partial [Psychrobacter sp. 1Y4]|uniref:WD40 repeat domain-containing protein n=1 Tax=Psychrobacter sp. 1Y4 TaxID=3453575 RepID=UPI003F4896DF